MDYEKKEGRYPEDLLIRARDEDSKMSISDNAFFVNIMKDPKVFKHIIRLVLSEEMEIVGGIEEAWVLSQGRQPHPLRQHKRRCRGRAGRDAPRAQGAQCPENR